MKIKELIYQLQQYDENLEVVRVVDFEETDEFGNCKVEAIEGTMTQTYVDTQFGDRDETVVMIY